MSNKKVKVTMISAPQAANFCGVSRNTVCTWIREGKLKSYKTVGGKNNIRPVDLKKFMKKYKMFIPSAVHELAEKSKGE